MRAYAAPLGWCRDATHVVLTDDARSTATPSCYNTRLASYGGENMRKSDRASTELPFLACMAAAASR